MRIGSEPHQLQIVLQSRRYLKRKSTVCQARLRDSCYFYILPRDWQSARSRCEEWGGHLATIGDETENNKIKGIAKKELYFLPFSVQQCKRRNRRQYGVGSREVQVGDVSHSINARQKTLCEPCCQGNFVSSHTGANLSYTNWHINEPNNWDNEDCVNMYAESNGTWNDIACNTSLPAACEVERRKLMQTDYQGCRISTAELYQREFSKINKKYLSGRRGSAGGRQQKEGQEKEEDDTFESFQRTFKIGERGCKEEEEEEAGRQEMEGQQEREILKEELKEDSKDRTEDNVFSFKEEQPISFRENQVTSKEEQSPENRKELPQQLSPNYDSESPSINMPMEYGKKPPAPFRRESGKEVSSVALQHTTNKLGSVTTSAQLRELARAPVFRTNPIADEGLDRTSNSDIDRNLNVLQKEIRSLRQTMNQQIDNSCDMMVYKPDATLQHEMKRLTENLDTEFQDHSPFTAEEEEAARFDDSLANKIKEVQFNLDAGRDVRQVELASTDTFGTKVGTSKFGMDEGGHKAKQQPKSNLERAREYRKGLQEELARQPKGEGSRVGLRQKLKTPMYVDFNAKQNRLLNRTAGNKEFQKLGPLDIEIVPIGSKYTRGSAERSDFSRQFMQTNSDLINPLGELTQDFGSMRAGRIEEELKMSKQKEDIMRKDRLMMLANENDQLKLAVDCHQNNEARYKQEIERLEKEIIFQKRRTTETERKYEEELEKYGGNFGLIETLKRKNTQLQQSSDIKIIELERQNKELWAQVEKHKQNELTFKNKLTWERREALNTKKVFENRIADLEKRLERQNSLISRTNRGTTSHKKSMSAKRNKASFSPNFETLEEDSCERRHETTEFSYTNQRSASRAKNSQTLSHIQIKDSKGKKPRFPQTPKSTVSYSRGLSQKSQKNKSLTLTRGESTERSRSESRRKCYACIMREDKKQANRGTMRRASTAQGYRRESGKLWKRQLISLGKNVIRYLREERNELLKMKEQFKEIASSIEEELVSALNALSENIEKVGVDDEREKRAAEMEEKYRSLCEKMKQLTQEI